MFDKGQILRKVDTPRDISRWDLYSILIAVLFLALQIARWRILPQFMDMYYHLLTAWGFLESGGYVGWDFWQYAPVGRPHIYPPFFHLLLAFLLKFGISASVLAKSFEVATPIVFLSAFWYFLRRNFNNKLAFFGLLAVGSSFSFYLSLINHIPATIAFIFGLLAFDGLLRKKAIMAFVFLTLCFYTHIGISWFFGLSFLIFGAFHKEYRSSSFKVLVSAFLAASLVFMKLALNFRNISNLGINLHEKYIIQLKFIDYFLAFLGLYMAWRLKKEYLVFLSLFIASFIFVFYPYRLFSAEGFLPIIMLVSLAFYKLYEYFSQKRIHRICSLAVILASVFLSPTCYFDRPLNQNESVCKIKLFDSAFFNMQFGHGETMWFQQEYVSSGEMIKRNSDQEDIVYSTIDAPGLAIASISGRASANGLFKEIGSFRKFDPFFSSRIIIFSRLDDPSFIKTIRDFYGLEKIGENKFFIFYLNPNAPKNAVIKASVPFWAVMIILLLLAGAYLVLRRRKII